MYINHLLDVRQTLLCTITDKGLSKQYLKISKKKKRLSIFDSL